MKKKRYELGGLTCGGCVNTVNKALLEISDVTVHLNPPTADLMMNKPVTLEVLQAQLKKVGQFTISELVTQ